MRRCLPLRATGSMHEETLRRRWWTTLLRSARSDGPAGGALGAWRCGCHLGRGPVAWTRQTHRPDGCHTLTRLPGPAPLIRPHGSDEHRLGCLGERTFTCASRARQDGECARYLYDRRQRVRHCRSSIQRAQAKRRERREGMILSSQRASVRMMD